MLSDAEFEAWISQRNLSGATHKLVAQIRASEPVRRVGGGYANVLKMCKTNQFESYKIEFLAIEEYEAGEEVLKRYDQPIRLKPFGMAAILSVQYLI